MQTAFALEIARRAFSAAYSDMGTNGLGWFVAIVSPVLIITNVSALMVAFAVPPDKITNVPPHRIEPSTKPPIARSASVNASPRRVMPGAMVDGASEYIVLES
jgi:hypothetical protein